MIAKLCGILDSTGDDWAVIDVHGVGYLVYAPARCLAKLPGLGEAVTFFIETHVREDHIHLYGFSEDAERAWFRLLLTVQGVGSKVALALLSSFSPDELSRIISSADKTLLSRAQGVGPKLAVRICTELKDKASLITPTFLPSLKSSAGYSIASGDGMFEDAISALINLGYRRIEAHAALVRAIDGAVGKMDVAAMIRAGLRELAQETAR